MSADAYPGILEITPIVLAQLLRGTLQVKIDSRIPLDAEFERCFYEADRDVICLVYRHPSFAKGILGHRIPSLPSPTIIRSDETKA